MVKKMSSNLKGVLKDLEKAFPGCVRTAADVVKNSGLTFKSTGSRMFDIMLGGGLAEGKVMELFGDFAYMKTTVAILMMVAAQKRGEVVVFIDAECSLNFMQAEDLGLNLDELIYVSGETGEQNLAAAVEFAESGEVGLIVLDSVAACTPSQEIADGMESIQIGLLARLFNKHMRVITKACNTSGCNLVLINQVRNTPDKYKPIVTPGGNGIKFQAFHRVQMNKPEEITIDGKKDSDIIGMEASFALKKSKANKIIKKTNAKVLRGEGYSEKLDLLNAASFFGLIKRAGAYYSYGDIKVQGKDNLISLPDEDMDKIRKDVDSHIEKLRAGATYQKTGDFYEEKIKGK